MVIECTLLLAGMLAAAPAAAPDPGGAAAKIAKSLGFTAEEQESIKNGEIVAHKMKELSDKELAITMAMLAPASLKDLLEFAKSGKGLEINRDILAHGDLGTGTIDDKSLDSAGFQATEAAEIRGFFEAAPGSKLNLSQAEIQRFADLRKKGPAKGCETDAACRDSVLSALRDMLKGRLKAYGERGLSGIEPYARDGGKTASPAEELRTATNAMELFSKDYPQVFDAFLNYPKGDQSGIENRFLWLKQTIQDRPTFILAHRVLYLRDGMAFAAERQFYVGQSYNSLQILYGLVPAGDKTIVFYVNRTSTDQVAGAMSGTRHGIGRKIMEKEIRKYFEEILASLKGSGS